MAQDLIKTIEDSFVTGAAGIINMGFPAKDVAGAMWRAMARIRDMERNPAEAARLAAEFKQMAAAALKAS